MENKNTEKRENFFKKAFKDMSESAKMQREVDKANFEAIKAESKANFEENRFENSFKRAKENSRKTFEDAKLSSSERQEKIRLQQEQYIQDAKNRLVEARERIAVAKQIQQEEKAKRQSRKQK